MAITIDIDARTIDELVRRGFLDPRGEIYTREEIKGALETWLGVSSAYQ
jgi:hypothetical protein